jgi:hypothetical protein
MGTKVAEGLAVGVSVEVGLSVAVAVLVASGVGVFVTSATSPPSLPGSASATTISTSPIRQNASKMINGMANLRLDNISRIP